MTVALLTCGCERTIPDNHPTDSLGMPRAIHCPHHRRAYAVLHTINQGYERDDLTIEISHEYADICARRLQQLSILGTDAA